MSGTGALHRFLKDRRGTSALEFAFAAPILILVLLGSIDFARALWAATTLAQAASEAGRYAAIRGAEKTAPATQAEIEAFARDQVVGLQQSDVLVDVTWSPNNTAGSSVTVQVRYGFDFLLIGFLPLPPIELSRQSTMTIA